MKPESHDYPEKGFPNVSCPRFSSCPLTPSLGPPQFLLPLTPQFPSPFLLPASTSLLGSPCSASPVSQPIRVFGLAHLKVAVGVPSLYMLWWSQWAGIPRKWGSQQGLTSAFVLENCCQDSKLLVPLAGNSWPLGTRKKMQGLGGLVLCFSDSFQSCCHVFCSFR